MSALLLTFHDDVDDGGDSEERQLWEISFPIINILATNRAPSCATR